jgi:hypothetical protein
VLLHSHSLSFSHSHFHFVGYIQSNLDIREESEEDVRTQFTKEELNDILRMKSDPKLYQNMVNSIAPAIYGYSLYHSITLSLSISLYLSITLSHYLSIPLYLSITLSLSISLYLSLSVSISPSGSFLTISSFSHVIFNS